MVFLCHQNYHIVLMSKVAQRQYYRKIRAAIPANHSMLWSERIANELLQALRARRFDGTVFLFKALQGEPDILPFLKDARLHIALPRVQSEGNMTFHLWSPGDDFIESPQGLKEPSPMALELVPREGDVAIVPSIAIDQFGRRLGFGGGYYDRWLSSHRRRLSLIIGTVFPPCFSSEPLATEAHDVDVDWCLTGEQTVNFRDRIK